MAKLTTSLPERFWARVDRKGVDECWLWQGSTDTNGYGQIRYLCRLYRTHQLALDFAGAERPEAPNNHALHGDSCVSRACCNPAHLRWGSNADNTTDRNRLGRTQKGERHWSAKLTEDDVRAIRASSKSTTNVAAEYGMSPITIAQIRSRRLWGHVA